MLRPSFKLFGAFILCLSVTGCYYSRTVVNEGTRDLDTSFIRVGETDWKEVFAKLGPPDVPLKDTRSFKYTSTDVRATGFIARYFLWLPFGWEDSVEVDEVLIECDERGKVQYVTRSLRDVVRPPFEDAADRRASSSETRRDSSEAPRP